MAKSGLFGRAGKRRVARNDRPARRRVQPRAPTFERWIPAPVMDERRVKFGGCELLRKRKRRGFGFLTAGADFFATKSGIPSSAAVFSSAVSGAKSLSKLNLVFHNFARPWASFYRNPQFLSPTI